MLLAGTRAVSALGMSGAPAPVAGQVRVAQFNVLNFFDTDDDPATLDEVVKPDEYRNKLAKLALAVRDTLQGADIIAMEEVENQRVLDDLLKQAPLAELGYKALFVEGNDKRGIDTAILYRAGRVQLKSHDTPNPQASSDLPPAGGSVDETKLFARPPLVATFEVQGASGAVAGARQLTVIANHFKSKRGEKDGSEDGRRNAQASFVGGLVDAQQAAHPQTPVIVLGDLNTLPGEEPLDRLAKRPDGSTRMTDLPMGLPQADRYSFIFKGQRNLLDHMFVTSDLEKALTSMVIPHINSGQHGDQSDPSTPNHVSDHDPLVATFQL